MTFVLFSKCHVAVLDNTAPILKYMGDYPSKKQRLSTDLTDAVFEHALVHVSPLLHHVKLTHTNF